MSAMTTYRVMNFDDGQLLDLFTTNADDLAEERIDKLRKFYPNPEVTEQAVPDSPFAATGLSGQVA